MSWTALAIPGHRSTDFEVAICQAYTTDAALEGDIEMDHDGTAVRQAQRSVEPIPPLTPAQEWQNLPASHAPPLESCIEVVARLGGDVTAFHLAGGGQCGEGLRPSASVPGPGRS